MQTRTAKYNVLTSNRILISRTCGSCMSYVLVYACSIAVGPKHFWLKSVAMPLLLPVSAASLNNFSLDCHAVLFVTQDCCGGNGDLLGGCCHDCKALFPVWRQRDQQNGTGAGAHAGVVLIHLHTHMETHTRMHRHTHGLTHACIDR